MPCTSLPIRFWITLPSFATAVMLLSPSLVRMLLLFTAVRMVAPVAESPPAAMVPAASTVKSL